MIMAYQRDNLFDGAFGDNRRSDLPGDLFS